MVVVVGCWLLVVDTCKEALSHCRQATINNNHMMVIVPWLLIIVCCCKLFLGGVRFWQQQIPSFI